LQVECAISRATKEKRVAELEEALKNSSVAFGVRYNKVSVSVCTISKFIPGLQRINRT
jgi:ribosomal protein L10